MQILYYAQSQIDNSLAERKTKEEFVFCFGRRHWKQWWSNNYANWVNLKHSNNCNANEFIPGFDFLFSSSTSSLSMEQIW